MTLSSLLDRATLAVARAACRTTMAELPEPAGQALFPATVAQVGEPAKAVRRITLHAPEFASLELAGPDEYFGLLMPGPRGDLELPERDRLNIRAAVAALPEERRPVLRWYTIRSLDPAAASIDVDIVTHGESGPGSAWASRTVPGDRVGFRQCGALFMPPRSGRACIVGDETSAPAVAAILERYGLSESRIIVEIPDEDHLTPLPEHPGLWIVRRSGLPGERALDALRDEDAARFDYFYLCGESRLATSCRRHLVRERGIDKHRIVFSGYWKLGQART